MTINTPVNRIFTPTPTALQVPTWDSNVNLSGNNLLGGFFTRLRVNSTTYTLTVGSAQTQQFTGASFFGDSVIMPVASTLVQGQTWYLINSAASSLAITTSAGTAILTLPAGTAVALTCILNSGTSAASWYFLPYTTTVTPTMTIGSWTPTISAQTPGTISVSYSSQTGYYMQFRPTPTSGSVVYLYCDMTATITTGTATGDMYITGLPFTASSNGSSGTIPQSSTNWTWGAGYTTMCAYISQSPIAVRFMKTGTAINSAALAITGITTGTSNIYRFSLTYQI